MINLNWQPGMTLESIEKEAILQAFRFYRGNKTATSNALGIAIRTLDNKLESYQADDKAKEDANAKRKRDHEEFVRRSRGEVARINHAASNVDFKKSDETDAGPVENGDDSERGVHMESSEKASEEHAVPMPVRKEVQDMPPRHASGSHSGKRR